MQHIELNNKTAIFLDHYKLINEIYNSNSATNESTSKYTLRPELFDYHEHKLQPKEENTHACTVVLKKQRKRKLVKKAQKEPSSQQHKELSIFISELLQQLNCRVDFSRRRNVAKLPIATLPRHWEESNSGEFPRFNGANSTDHFQQHRFDDRSFIIPPHCRFFNTDILQLTQLLPQLASAAGYDLIVLDPPWRNKYIRRVKRARRELGYQMLDIEQLAQLPIATLTHASSLVAIWCTNSQQIQQALLSQLLPAWNLRLLHSVHWFKLSTAGTLIHAINDDGYKQPYEMLYLATHVNADAAFGRQLQRVAALLSVPSIVHSHKPPLLPWLRQFLPAQPQCLELFARYLQPQYTSIGLEVLKLMDARLYECTRGDDILA